MRKTIFITGLFLLFSILSCKKKDLIIAKNTAKSDSIAEAKFKLSKKTDYTPYYTEAHQYCKNNNLNQEKFILIDLGVHSGLKRFFVYDFKAKKIIKSFIVSHGCGDAVWGDSLTKEEAQISNEPDSHCSSIGKYIVLNRGISQWGIKVNYVLQGKDKTNSNAQNRAIVLHSWEEIPNDEIFPDGTPEGWGCPAVSNKSMIEIDSILKENKKVLLWVIKS